MPLALEVENLEVVPEEVRTLYKEQDGKFRLDVEGVEDTSALKTALQKEREAAKTAKAARRELEEKFRDVDIEKYRELMERIEKDEDMKLVAEKQYDKLIEKRTEKLRSDFKRQVEEAAEREKQAGERLKKYQQRVLDDNIRAAASKAGIHVHAVEDALFRARAMFTLDDEGNAVQLGSDGLPVLGKDGKTPFSPAEWLESMKETAPHWFPATSTGGGASGDRGGQGSAKTMKRATFDQLPPHERMSFIRGGGKLTD